MARRLSFFLALLLMTACSGGAEQQQPNHWESGRNENANQGDRVALPGKILPPETGVYLGQAGTKEEIAGFERVIGRRVAIAADFSIMRGQEEVGEGGLHFNVRLARRYWERGSVVFAGAYEAFPGNKPFTVDKLLRGKYDDDLKKLAAQFRAFGKPMFFGTAREPNGPLAPWYGGYGPDGDKGVRWAERTGRRNAEFKPPAPPAGNPKLYAGLGDPKIDDGIERLAAAQRYYYDFFLRREGLSFLTFETMGWAVPIWESEPTPIADFEEFYRLVADYSDWVSIDFYMASPDVNEDTGERLTQPPKGHYLRALKRVMQQIHRIAPDKPVLLAEFGFGEPDRAEKVDRGLREIIKQYPQIKGFILFTGDFAIRPATPAGLAFKKVIDENATFFHSRVRFSHSGDNP